MAVTLEDIAARLERIEAALNAQPVTVQAAPSRAILSYTPRELAAKIGRSYRWVLSRCQAGTIPTTTRKPPYLIPAGAADEMFSMSKGVFNQ